MTPQSEKNSAEVGSVIMGGNYQADYDRQEPAIDSATGFKNKEKEKQSSKFISERVPVSMFAAEKIESCSMTVSDLLEIAITEATNRLAMTIVAVDNIAKLRTAMKMSCSRASGVKRELIELQKVLAGYGHK